MCLINDLCNLFAQYQIIQLDYIALISELLWIILPLIRQRVNFVKDI